MNWALLSLSVVMLATEVTVEPLSGPPVSGQILQLNDQAVVLESPKGKVEVPLEQVLTIRQMSVPVPSRNDAIEPGDKTQSVVELTDGSRLVLGALALKQESIQGTHAALGDVSLPSEELRCIRMAPLDGKVESSWKELVSRKITQDMVVLRKGDVLDHLEGTIVNIGDKTLSFLLDGDEVPVKRERVFGLCFASRTADQPAEIRVDLGKGEVIRADQVEFEDGTWKLQRGDETFSLSSDHAPEVLDYSAGKLMFLSDVEPRDVRYEPFFGYTWEYRKNRSFEGRPLAVGSKTYRRGLAIHSKSELTWRLGGDYRRFQSVIGFDPEITTASTALVQVLGDGKKLMKLDLSRNTPPHAVDLDISDLVELTIVVDYGSDEVDIGDRIHFGDAKVVK